MLQLSQQPRGLYVLFFTEMWERFCYYGMRALFILYMTNALLFSDEKAYGVYGAYGTLVYISPIIGGLFADRVLGYRRAILSGGVLMALGQMFLMIQQLHFFYTGLALMIVGNGLLKPNLATLLGKLYDNHPAGRETGFTIYYVGINLGSALAPLACGFVGEVFGWHFGFGLAGLGMLVGLYVFYHGEKHLAGHGNPPSMATLNKKITPGISIELLCYMAIIAAVPFVFFIMNYTGWLLLVVSIVSFGSIIYTAFSYDARQRNHIFALLMFMCFSMIFWSFTEQSGSSLNLFTERNINHQLFGWLIPTSFFQSFNPFYILVFGPLFAMMWSFLSKHNWNPSVPLKFCAGLLQLGLGFAVFSTGAARAVTLGHVSMGWIALGYLLMATGELCIEPIGMSLVTRLSPKNMVGMMMGCWFLADGAISNYLAAKIASLTSASSAVADNPYITAGLYHQVFYEAAVAAMIASGVILLLSPLLKRMIR